MALETGARLGAFEIVSILGEGGMGRVYRARDTKLQRQVAIKVLPDDVAADPERVARFEREARTLAALNHPHIAQIYGTEQCGQTHALVMELVDGEDLLERIARGPMPWREASPIARQIAEALEAAHEQGIIHRDLKPANIKVTHDGVVKVLDFGLAKAVNAAAESSPASATVTSPAAMTQAGFVLGTAAYMSPEQAKGRPADKRSDVWAFGCVVYEMLTGKRAFPGDDVVDTLAAVVRGDPDFSQIPGDVPAEITGLIARCLVKDRRERISDLAVVRYALDGSRHTPSDVRAPRRIWPWAIALAATAAAFIAVALPRFGSRNEVGPPIIRSAIDAPTAATGGILTIAISRQGTDIAYAGIGRLMVRRLSESAPRPLQGSDGGSNPFFSFDGEWVGFFADGKLKKVPLSGGAAEVLADAASNRGGSWSRDDTIVFAPTNLSGLSKVSAGGGPVTTLTTLKPDQRSHRFPQVLPDGRTVIFTVQLNGKQFDDAQIAAVPIDGGEPRTLIESGSGAQFAESGHLLYGNAGSLLATAFDPVALRASGPSIAVLDNIRTNLLNGAVPFAVSSAGLFVYLPGGDTGLSMNLLSATRTGQTQPILERRQFNSFFRISPDGTRVAVSISDGLVDIWTVDLKNRATSRLTLAPGSESFPVWSPDGARLYYMSNTGGGGRAVAKRADGTGPEEAISTSVFLPMTVSPDGRIVAGRVITTTDFDVATIDLVKKSPPVPVVATRANEMAPAFSPDGRFLAYQSDETGRNEIFVQEFPTGSTVQVTTGGGVEPHWTSGGREIVYRNGNTILGVPVMLHPFSAGQPQTLFSAPNLFGFDVTPDGKRFVIAQDSENRDNITFVLVSGWFEELRVKMQSGR